MTMKTFTIERRDFNKNILNYLSERGYHQIKRINNTIFYSSSTGNLCFEPSPVNINNIELTLDNEGAIFKELNKKKLIN